MSRLDVIRAWQDSGYRLGLSTTDQVLSPTHAAGLVQLTDAQLDEFAGGCGPACGYLIGVCGSLTAACIWEPEKCVSRLEYFLNYRPEVGNPNAEGT
jgi:mersacidin/lichenicidin family type 2 lantibiotic